MSDAWDTKPLGEIITLQRGFDLPMQLRSDGEIAVIGSNGIVGFHNLTPASVPIPGLMLGRSGSVGEITLWGKPYWPLNTVLYVKDFHGNDPRFLSYWLRLFPFKQYAEGVSVPTLNRNSIHDVPFPLPKLDDQLRISIALAAIEVGINCNSRALVTAHELKRASMRKLFTRGLRGETQKETEIGLVPESWEPRAVLDLCEIQSGGTPRKSVAEYWVGEIPWASGKDLKVPTLRDTIDHISEGGVNAGSRLAPTDAVLILVRGMGLVKDLPVAVISRPMAFNQDLKALVSRGEFSGTYVRSAIYCAKDRLLSRIVPSAHGTMTLNLDDIETFKIACPSDPDEANEIVEILNALDRKIDLHGRKRAILDKLFEALLHKLMTGEIRAADLDLSALGVPTALETAA